MNQICIPVCTDDTIAEATKTLEPGSLLFNKDSQSLYIVHKVGDGKGRTLVGGDLKQDKLSAGDNIVLDKESNIDTADDIDVDHCTISPVEECVHKNIEFPPRHNSTFLLLSKKEYECYISGFFLLKFTGLSHTEYLTGQLHVASGDNGYSLVSSTSKIPLDVVQVLLKDGQYYNGIRIPPRDDGSKPVSFQLCINGFVHYDQDVLDMKYNDSDIVSFTTLPSQNKKGITL